MKNFSLTRRHRGLTLTELLVVMLIIGLLSTIALPVYINRMEDARVRVAMGEMREIAMAEEQCALIHGFYVPFQVLDDIAEPIDGTPINIGDTIVDDNRGQLFVINPLVQPLTQFGNQLRLADDGFNQRIYNMVFHWSGPFIQYQRVYIGNGVSRPGTLEYEQNILISKLDFPLDPWGTPYRFYSPIGLIGTAAIIAGNQNNSINVAFSDGVLTTNDNRNYSTYHVVSYGRDGFSQTLAAGFPIKDDLQYAFGSPGVESGFGTYF